MFCGVWSLILGTLNSEYKIWYGNDYSFGIKENQNAFQILKKLTVITQTIKMAQYFYQFPA
jgi:hypothetical protein